MKEFKDCGAWGSDYEYRIEVVYIGQTPYLSISEWICSLNGAGTTEMDLNIYDILHMTEPELIDLNDCIFNQLPDVLGCVTEIYDMKKHEVGLYLDPIISLFRYTKNNLMVELVYDRNDDGGYRLRKVDTLNNRVIEGMALSRDAASFIMETIMEFYEKNKGKV